MWYRLVFLLLAFMPTLVSAQCPGPSQRQALLNLQRAIEVEGSRAGQIGLTDSCGNQGYQQYVEVNLDTIAYTPTTTGNTQNLSEFVLTPAGRLFYIDWQGNAIEFVGGAASCDADWLQISDNSCPDAITDSIYKQKYASVGARLVWPGAELLVSDSVASGIVVVQGSRNARVAWYDSNAGTFSMFDHGGSSPIFYMPVGANMVFKTTAGTPQTPLGSQVSHFAINTQDSTIQAFQYQNTRADTQTTLNFIYTDAVGKFRSKPVSEFPLAGLGGIYGGSGNIANGAIATVFTNSDFQIAYPVTGAQALWANDATGTTSLFNKDGLKYIQLQAAGSEFILGADLDNFVLNSGTAALTYGIGNGSLRLSDSDNSQHIDIKTPVTGSLTSNWTLTLPTTDGNSGEFLQTDGNGTTTWASAGTGSVTSVGLSLPSIFSVSGSPVTTSGTLTGTLATQTANTIFAGPTSGGAAAPTFRSLVAADINSLAWVKGGNSFAGTSILGTNDANALQFETNDTVRATLSTTGVFKVSDSQASTNQALTQLVISNNSDGTAAVGLGVAMGFQAKNNGLNDQEQGYISTRWSAVGASQDSEMDFWTVSGAFPIVRMTVEANGDVGIGTQNPSVRLCNVSTSIGDGSANVSSNGMGWSLNSTGSYVAGVLNSSTTTTAHGLMIRSAATDNATRALTVSVGTATKVLSVNCDQTVGILDITPEAPLDVEGTTKTIRLVGQDNTPTITVDAAGAGTGATALMTNAQSSDLAGRFSITSGTGATTGRWASITFGGAYAVTPVVIPGCEDADCAATTVGWYVNTSTTGFEIFCTGAPASSTTYEFAFHVIGGK